MIVDDDAEMRTLLAEYFADWDLKSLRKKAAPLALQAVDDRSLRLFHPGRGHARNVRD